MNAASHRGVGRVVRASIAAAAITLGAGCQPSPQVPAKTTKEYTDAVAAFYAGLAALQVGDDARADARLGEATRLAPGEPAAWGNWAALAMRQRNLDVASQRLDKARQIAPQDAHLNNLIGLLESARGRPAEAMASFRKAAELDPADLSNLYALAQEVERQGGAASDAEFQQLIEKIVAADPNNLAALLELCRIAAKRGDANTVRATIARLAARAPSWPPEVQEQFTALQTAAEGPDLRAAAQRTTLLRNVLLRVPEYRSSYARIKAPAGEEVQPYTRFVRMETPTFAPAPADTSLAFDPQPVAGSDAGSWSWIGAVQLGSGGPPVVAVANGSEIRVGAATPLAFPGGQGKASPSPEGVLQIDFTYDFKTDLIAAGAGGVRFYRQDSSQAFTDVTAETRLPQSIVAGAYTGAWTIDIEADGDLDVVLGVADGPPRVLRNNGDGTFVESPLFAAVSGLRQLVWVDIDGDGNPDVAMIDGTGRLHLFMNERQGAYRERTLPANAASARAIAVADANNDGVLDLIAVSPEGAVMRISDRNQRQAIDVAEIARVANAADMLAGDVRLRAGDLDNNGAVDLYLSAVAPTPGRSPAAPIVWLANERGGFDALQRPVNVASLFDAADLGGNGKLDLLGVSADGRAVRAGNRGTRNYHWQVVRPRAVQAFGDQRINPFGVGGEIEIRAGLLVQKQPIAGPQVHFGLGEQTRADVVRVIWPNGVIRAEFDVKADQSIETEQRLKGSCPFLFAFDGTRFKFVKDAVPWGSAIGLRINTLGSADIAATEEWYKIGRKDLAARDGFYDLRFTAELWEVYYYDHLALMTVDHPAGTEIFVDERFVIPPAKLAVTAVATPQPIVRAVDDTGRDVTEIVKAVDGRSLDGIGRGQYQGVTRDHYLEVDLGDAAAVDGPLYLIAHGSIYPTDSSINVALSQGERWRAHGLSLEVPDGRGGWTVANDNLGFPAGRMKTMLVDLSHAFRDGTPRRVRLRTNLEIYWDAIEWARGAPDTPLRMARLDPAVADLHYRGYSAIDTPDQRAPEVPDYQRITGTTQRWRDLEGYYTRFGDVRELLSRADDRYVIMNAGDEMSLRFAEPPPPPAGWVRDFVIVGDGWIKDGDYNSTFSKTVLPLPYHAKQSYTDPPGRLEDEHVYRMHPGDWQTYHTRYVTPDIVMNALRTNPRP